MGQQYNKLDNLQAAFCAHTMFKQCVTITSCEHHPAIQMVAEVTDELKVAPTTFLEVHYIFNGEDRVAHFFNETNVVLVFHVSYYEFDEDDGSEYDIDHIVLFRIDDFFRMAQDVINEYEYTLSKDPSITHGIELIDEFAAGDTPTAT